MKDGQLASESLFALINTRRCSYDKKYIKNFSAWHEGAITGIIGRQSEGSIIRGFVNQKWVPYSQWYLFNAISDTNHNANPTNPNHYSKGNPNPTNPNTRYRIIEPSDY